tara:strand:- start:35 stop:1171 length:1137 start_codon:yes stop_codon:yes gene_type:complete
MTTQLRDLISSALYPTKAYTLPAVCERFGLEPGTVEEAFQSKNSYVMRRLERLSDEQALEVARKVVRGFPADDLQAAIERLDLPDRLLTDLTRRRISELLDEFPLNGKRDVLELLREYWPEIDHKPSNYDPLKTIADDIFRHAIQNYDWSNSELLEQLGILKCSQARLFRFLEALVHPIRRDQAEQEKLVGQLNLILQRDGYRLTPAETISGYPAYVVRETPANDSHPADELISKNLVSFDEGGVHQAWQKALERRSRDPEGAITAARTLVETVCKHIIDTAGGSYSYKDDLPKLYATAAELLNLAPSQHTEKEFRGILGNCQAVVGTLATLRNRLGDSHGQGKRYVKPSSRHADLAVNLAGSMSMFLVSTWIARNNQ